MNYSESEANKFLNSDNGINYQQKYMKYKKKYMGIKSQQGGAVIEAPQMATIAPNMSTRAPPSILATIEPITVSPSVTASVIAPLPSFMNNTEGPNPTISVAMSNNIKTPCPKCASIAPVICEACKECSTESVEFDTSSPPSESTSKWPSILGFLNK
jgi:hypothetical protein